MRVEILTFGILKDLFSASFIELNAQDEPGATDGQVTVDDLLRRLREELAPDKANLLQGIAVSVNAQFARGDHRLKDGDVVGLLPPVSGGSADEAVVTLLTRQPIQTAQWIESIRRPSDGAVTVFDGIVRDHTRTRRTLFLDYEAYEEMAEAKLRELAEAARERFAVRAVTIVHRLGRLEIGETSVLIVVAAEHRAAALEASRWLIDTLKRTVPIWKKETFEDGAVWADGEPFPDEIALADGAKNAPPPGARS